MNVQIMNLLMPILPKKANHLMSCYESQPIPWIHILATRYKKWDKSCFSVSLQHLFFTFQNDSSITQEEAIPNDARPEFSDFKL